MRLSELIQENHAASRIEILGLSADSRAVQPGYLFAALSGTEQDGAAYIGSAIEQGAVAVLTGPHVPVPSKAVYVVADNNPRRRLALLDHELHNPGEHELTRALELLFAQYRELVEEVSSLGSLHVETLGEV